MHIFPFRIKQYLRLLTNYIFYDLPILLYIVLILTTFFFAIITIVKTEIHRNLIHYGGIHEAKTSYTIDLGLGATQKELLYLFELLKDYNVQEIKEIWINIPPLSKVGIASSNDFINHFEQDNYDFTGHNLIHETNKIILSNEDYQTYFKDYTVGDILSIGGTEFQLTNISYTLDHSIIPLNNLFTAQTPFFIDHLVLRTEYVINRWERKSIQKKYIHKALPNKYKDTFSFESNFQYAFSAIWNSMSNYIISIGLIFIFCLLLFFQTYSILYHKNLSHNYIYQLTGAPECFFSQIILGELIASTAMALILAYLLFLGKILWINKDIFYI